ncbi:hypothetical protein SAMN05192558_12513 [Actinokineospora alba]|uniref:MerR, DNA binding n=1 Tax=Actinokineospora alba TaxID=504798 RepID=A0A1H0WMU4_9PSEU|nr:hypothetical protein [Actinokineospora alba]SDJ53619.1 hypothetical protein SAMN05421871_11913 [Actinokineospora alba]SDP91967.1 hypothetical protein SAMN05192558_12513 [Actinokineospora alba]
MLPFLTKQCITGVPVPDVRVCAALCRQGPVTVAPRKEILERHRDDVRERIRQLLGCLDILDYKIDNYDRLARSQEASA